MRVGVFRFRRALNRVEVGAAIQLVVLVPGALGEQGPERVNIGGDMLRAQPGRNAPIEETSRRV